MQNVGFKASHKQSQQDGRVAGGLGLDFISSQFLRRMCISSYVHNCPACTNLYLHHHQLYFLLLISWEQPERSVKKMKSIWWANIERQNLNICLNIVFYDFKGLHLNHKSLGRVQKVDIRALTRKSLFWENDQFRASASSVNREQFSHGWKNQMKAGFKNLKRLISHISSFFINISYFRFKMSLYWQWMYRLTVLNLKYLCESCHWLTV